MRNLSMAVLLSLSMAAIALAQTSNATVGGTVADSTTIRRTFQTIGRS